MSRGYVVNWVNVRNTVNAGDQVTIDVELMPIVCEGDMQSLLQQQLEADGWKRQSDGSMVLEKEGVRATLDKDSKKITVKSSETREVLARGISDQEAKKALETASSAAEEALRKELVKKLSRVEGDIREGVDKAIQRVYLEALKKKAASLGTIEGMQESRREDGEYEITIRVRT
jgi:hypothetical protein